jgi:hypothetical protein
VVAATATIVLPKALVVPVGDYVASVGTGGTMRLWAVVGDRPGDHPGLLGVTRLVEDLKR